MALGARGAESATRDEVTGGVPGAAVGSRAAGEDVGGAEVLLGGLAGVSGKRGEAAGTDGALDVLGAASGMRACGAAGVAVEGPTPVAGARVAGCEGPPGVAGGAVTRGLEAGADVAVVAGRAALGDPEAGAAGAVGPADVRGGGRPGAPGAGTPGADDVRAGAKGAAGTPVRGQAGIVPVGIRSGRRGTEPGEPLVAPVGGAAGEGGRAAGLAGGAGAAGAGGVRGAAEPVATGVPDIGVRTGGLESNAGPGRGTGVSIGICVGPEAVGGSSLNGSGVSFGGPAAAGGPRRSSGSSRRRISGAGRSPSMPGSQAVQSPCGGNSAPHLRHLDTAA